MSQNRTATYDPKKVIVILGSHTVTGFADDSFVSVEPKGDGITAKNGCDGEVARAINPDRSFTIKVSLLQTSKSNSYLQGMHNKDLSTGDGTFPVLVKDLRGGMVFSADVGWITKAPPRAFGKDTNNREWTIETGPGTLTE